MDLLEAKWELVRTSERLIICRAMGVTQQGFRLLAHPTPVGCAAMHYPEADVVIGTGDRSNESGTPSYKSIPIDLRRPRSIP